MRSLASYDSSAAADYERKSAATAGPSLAEYANILFRRRWLILNTFAVILLAGALVTLHAKPVYQGSARLLVDPGSDSITNVDTSNPLSGLLAPKPVQPIDTQVELVQTQPVLQRAADALGLPVGYIAGSISVSVVQPTDIIEIDAQSSNAKMVADIANAVAKAYLDEEQSQNLADVRSAKQFVQSKLDQARQNLQASSKALEEFEQEQHIASMDKSRDDQISFVSSLNAQIQQAEPDLASARAEEARDKQLLASQPLAIVTPLPQTNPAISVLQATLTQLEVQRASMTQPGGFTSRAPQIRAIDGQIAAIRARLNSTPPILVTKSSTPNPVRDQLLSKLADVEVTEATLTSRLAALNQQREIAQNTTGKYAVLGVTSDRLTAQYQDAVAAEKMYSDQLRNLTLREQAQHAPAEIVDSAVVPDAPIKPNKPQAILFCGVLGVLMGVCLALLIEFMDDRLHSIADAERALGMAAMGRIPQLPAAQTRLLTSANPLSPFAESYRLLRTNLQFASIDVAIRTLLVTSATPGEGKTTVAANLALAMALNGKKVALVDANLRRPAVHQLLELPAVPGLTDVLLGEASLSETLLDSSQHPNLVTLPCGSPPPNPSELLGSERFKDVIHELTNMVDVVIVDSPPLLAGADAQVLSAQMDGVLLVMLPGGTSKSATKLMMEQLHQARANVVGVAYNQVAMPPVVAYTQNDSLESTEPARRLESSDMKTAPVSKNGTHKVAAATSDGREGVVK